jgi:hypothetical protein
MTEPVTPIAMSEPTSCPDHAAGFRTSLLPIFLGLLFLLLAILSEQQPAFHIGFDSTRHGAMVAVSCLAAMIAASFHFAQFSFGYFAGFYFFTMMAGYFWLNAFSVLVYDHTVALISAIGSVVLFLMPCLLIRAPASQPFALSHRAFDLLPDALLCLSTVVLVACSLNGFHFVGFEKMGQYRGELTHSPAIEYAIGNVNGALIPFAFACLFARRRWFMLSLLVVVSLSYYPVTLTKISLFAAPFLIFVAFASTRFEARTCVILSLCFPLAVGLMAFGLLASKLFTSEWINTFLLYIFLTFDFRLPYRRILSSITTLSFPTTD